ncbi:MAG TPA: DUF3078 domain-containing protein [Flavisolibacter sp.]|jgi:hypothetical protein|nr:DUF3078 domain-containing protein [Flavisolibacter sp.]
MTRTAAGTKTYLAISFTLIFLFSIELLQAQDETVKKLQAEANRELKGAPADTLPRDWHKGGVISLTLAQGSLTNWAAGGDKFSLSINNFIHAYANYKKDKHSWDNNIDFYLGYVKTTSLGNRKNDDRFEYLTRYGYALHPRLNLSGLFNLRTQFFKGYQYPEANQRLYVSNFFAPAYLLLSAGLDYKPIKDLSIYFSPATARWILVRDTSLGKYYGVDPGSKKDFQFGSFASINYKKDINKTVSYTGKLDLFSNYRHNPQNIDLYMTNLFAAKISKFLSVTYSLTFIYDDDVKLFGPSKDAPRLQTQSLLGVGLLLNVAK